MSFFQTLAGALGALLLLSIPLTFLSTSDTGLYFWGKVALGVLLLGVYLLARSKHGPSKSVGKTPVPQTRFFMRSNAAVALTLMFLLVLLNIVASRFNGVFDFTQKRIFTLSPQSQATLSALREPVNAIAFFPPTHPNYDEVASILKQYAAVSSLFRYEFRDPERNPDWVQKYKVKSGETPLLLVQGVRQASLDLIGEQEITNALLKLNSAKEHKIYFLQGHGEWALKEKELLELSQSLQQEGYVISGLSLFGESKVPDDAAAIVVAGAKTAFHEREMELISNYMRQGGRLLYFADAGFEPGLDGLLSDFAIQIDNGLAADTEVNPRNPYELVTQIFSEHPITRMLKQMEFHVVFPTARALSILRSGFLDGVRAEPLVLTFPSAWLESEPDGLPRLTDGEKSGVLPLVAVSTLDTRASPNKRLDEARMVVFGDSELLLDAQWGHEGNRNLVLNAFAWASAQVMPLSIRPPDRDFSTVELPPQRLMHLRFWALDVLPLAFVGMALAFTLRRRRL